ncbi:hypothetical protein FHS18_001664 [Paenibacillus phyllosphaerae]|uniref:Uncharacterized protein n=1 Tax=Paenibacillus phyllosphaerae TaxID=274593 RepID=A0A7W5FLW2_9BACL|nr:hypothetical protein [Paenibacillus phyllosphaerae]MBB3109601.1 hypothetical protein [Paenibacillus phyllosphaerae]
MYIVSVFGHSLSLELALQDLEGVIPNQRILAIPLDKEMYPVKINHPYNHEGLNLFFVSCLSSITMLLGVIYGFILYWGPIIWGMIGLAGGACTGLILQKVVQKRKQLELNRSERFDVIIIIRYESQQESNIIRSILSEYSALSITDMNKGFSGA